MTKNPFFNALAAAAYICALVGIFSLFVDSDVEQVAPLLIPILMLSIVTLSAAYMSFTFFYHPFQLYFDGKRGEAVTLLGTTIGYFGGFVGLLLVAVLAIAYL